MPLGSGNIIQHASSSTGSSTPTSVTVSLSSTTTGHTVLIGLTSDEVATPPAGFTQDGYVTASGIHHYLWRKQTSTAESSWVVTFASTIVGAWWVEEVSGLDSSPVTAGITNNAATVSSISTGSTPATGYTDLLCVASYASYIGSNTTMTFSGETNSFTEVEDNTGSVVGGEGIAVALAHRFPGSSGSFTTTATISTTADIASGILVVYKAVAAPATVIDDVTVGGTFPFTAEVTSRSGGDTHLDLYTSDTTVQGSIVLVHDLSVTGTMNFATSAISVVSTSVTFQVGDVVQSDLTGECMVVRDSWTGTAGPMWSNTADRSTQYTTTGWTVIGSASLS